MAKAIYIPMVSEFDSKEEFYFSWWLDELKAAGYIKEIVYQPDSYVTVDRQTFTEIKRMKTKDKPVVKTLVQERVYTPDYKVVWTEKANRIFYRMLHESDFSVGAPFWANAGPQGPYTVFEVKALFDNNNMTRLAAINMDVVLQKYGVYIEMAKMGNKKAGMFSKTFTPAKYTLTDKTAKPRKLHYDPVTLEEYISARKAVVDSVCNLR